MKNVLIVGIFLVVGVGIFLVVNKQPSNNENNDLDDYIQVEKIENIKNRENRTRDISEHVTPEQVAMMQEKNRQRKYQEKYQDKRDESLAQGESRPLPLTEEELDELEEYFDEVEETWSADMEKFITKELNLSKEAFETYQNIKENYEKEKYQAFNDFHEEMIKKYGNDYKYHPSEFDEKFENTFRGEYLSQIKDLLGEGNMPKYLEMLDQVNEKIMRDAKPGHGHINMDL